LRNPHHKHIIVTKLVKEVLHDWLHLATTTNETSVPLHTMVPCAPYILAATDAS
jgi:hypothetical protein